MYYVDFSLFKRIVFGASISNEGFTYTLDHGANSSDVVALTADSPCTSPVAVLGTIVILWLLRETATSNNVLAHGWMLCTYKSPYSSYTCGTPPLPPHERYYPRGLLLPPIWPILKRRSSVHQNSIHTEISIKSLASPFSPTQWVSCDGGTVLPQRWGIGGGGKNSTICSG